MLVQPCGRFGAVRDGAPALPATAQIRVAPEDVLRARHVVREAHPDGSRAVLGMERLAERLRGRGAARARCCT